jgi:hypothetical protein
MEKEAVFDLQRQGPWLPLLSFMEHGRSVSLPSSWQSIFQALMLLGLSFGLAVPIFKYD